jgi:hypothetical protein
MAQPHQFQRGGAAEASQADDGELSHGAPSCSSGWRLGHGQELENLVKTLMDFCANLISGWCVAANYDRECAEPAPLFPA